MNITHNNKLTEEDQIVLDALKSAVANALEKKRKLGQYAVIWDGEKPVLSGADAPEENKA